MALALLVDRRQCRMHWRIHVEPDNARGLPSRSRVVGRLEGAQPVRLRVTRIPGALHRTQAGPGGLCHGLAGPMRDLPRRLGTGPRQDFRHGRHGQLRHARRACLVAQRGAQPCLDMPRLPAPRSTGDRTEQPSLGELTQFIVAVEMAAQDVGVYFGNVPRSTLAIDDGNAQRSVKRPFGEMAPCWLAATALQPSAWVLARVALRSSHTDHPAHRRLALRGVPERPFARPCPRDRAGLGCGGEPPSSRGARGDRAMLGARSPAGPGFGRGTRRGVAGRMEAVP